MELIEIKDTLKAAKDYLDSLQKLNNDLEEAERQITTTANKSYNNVEVMFTTILDKITNCLNTRREKLQNQILEIKKQSVLPLQDCRNVVSDKIENTSQLINLGTQLVKSRNPRDVEDFNNKSRFLGSLPEVPDLKEVPFVCFQFEPSVEKELADICSSFGTVSKIAPVQICSTIERPGAILVEWRSTDNDDRSNDIQEFRLQRAYGNVIKDEHLIANFHDSYTGTENIFLVKDLQSNQEYSFRVCCKYEGSSIWSQWSVPQVAVTEIPKFQWSANNSDFLLSNENSIAKANKEPNLILYSEGPSIFAGYSVEFTFLECDSNLTDNYVGLCKYCDETDINKLKLCSFLLEANGAIIINGQVKSTKLPEITKGSKVCFTCDSCNDGKVRINVDSNDKRVTYDWMCDKNSFFFFAYFNSAKWKVMVE